MREVSIEQTMEEVLTRTNLQRAWRAVKRNQGSAGVDGRTIGQTGEHLREHWSQIREKLMAGTYQPSPIRAVSIPKASGGTRTLGIPTVQDRLIQQALGQILSERAEENFSAHSYGFRPGRSAHDAVRAA